MKLLKAIILLLISTLYGSMAHAQGWQKIYDLGGIDESGTRIVSSGNGYVIAGGTRNSLATSYNPFLFKVDQQGQVVWSKVIHPTVGLYTEKMILAANGDYILSGYTQDSTNSKAFVGRFNANGDSLWVKTYGGNLTTMQARSLVETSTGNILLALNYTDTSISPFQNMAFMQLSAIGDSMRLHITGRDSISYVMQDMINTFDHNVLTAGYINNSNSVIVVKTTELGDTLWTHILPDTSGSKFPWGVIQTRDSGFVLTGMLVDNITVLPIHSFLMKTDQNGNELWTKKYIEPNKYTYSQGVLEDAQGRLVMVDNNEVPDQHASYHWTPMFRMTDANGNELKRKSYNNLPGIIAEMTDVVRTPDNGYIFVGGKGYYRTLGDVFLIKVDSVGNLYNGRISGNIFYDANNNCTQDSAELPLSNFIIKASGANDYYTVSDSLGGYSIECDTGTYHLSQSSASGYWVIDSTCDDSLNFQVTANVDTVVRNLALRPDVPCAFMQVHVDAAILRICIPGPPVMVNYCNLGTAPASGVYIDITLAADMILDSSTATYTAQGNNVYRFNIGNVNIGQCGDFAIHMRADCNVLPHSALCMSAHIYPDSSCTPASPIWDQSHLEISSTCGTDSLLFKVTNTGSNMNSSVQYRIIQDDVLYANGTIQLNALGLFTKKVPADGHTWTFITAQTAGHPGNSKPLLSVEGCGRNSLGGYSLGYAMMYPQNNQDAYYDVLCIEARTSHDPNEKVASPRGLSASGEIDKSQPITYTIGFQNTGNDTAFTVVVVDTLSPLLDISTLHVTGSSHPYHWTLTNNVLQFTFYPIFLPDSTTNEPASNGFISFTISPKLNLATGSQIENTAYIYFDANPPVQTNTTLNTIGELYKQWLAVTEISDVTNNLHCYPNPNAGQLMLEYKGNNDDAVFAIYDVLGTKVFEQKATRGTQQLNISSLNSGVYIYKLIGKGETASGKITKF